MPVLTSPFTCKQIADAAGCAVTKATDRLGGLEARLTAILARPEALATNGRPMPAAQALVAAARLLTALDAADHAATVRWLCRIQIDGRRSA